MGMMAAAGTQRHEFVQEQLNEYNSNMNDMLNKAKEGAKDMSEVKFTSAATFDEMQIAVDNYTLHSILDKLNKDPVYYTYNYIIDYAFNEFRYFMTTGARLKPGHLKEFIEILFKAVEDRSSTIRFEVTDSMKRNIDLIQSKAASIDKEFCTDLNDYYDRDQAKFEFDLSKYHLTEENEMSKMEFAEVGKEGTTVIDTPDEDVVATDRRKDATNGNDDTCGTFCSPERSVGLVADHDTMCDTPDEDCFDTIEGCAGCCHCDGDYVDGIGDVYHGPIINFNAPIIYMGSVPSNDVFENVRNILLDFYNTHPTISEE